MGIFDYISTVNFDKESFFGLVDVDKRLDNETKQNLWDEFAIYSNQNLITFYNSLKNAPIPLYVKQSMNQFFYLKALEYLPK